MPRNFLRTSPPIAAAPGGFAIVPRIGKKLPFYLFLPPKCQTPHLI